MKNILFFLIPKKDVIFLNIESTLKIALEVLEKNRYTAIPLIDKKGKYVGTLTEGDLLWKIKNTKGLNFENCSAFTLREINRRFKNKAIRINQPLNDIIELTKTQNFVPVVDDNGIFIGIIRRQEVIDYLLTSNSSLEVCASA